MADLPTSSPLGGGVYQVATLPSPPADSRASSPGSDLDTDEQDGHTDSSTPDDSRPGSVPESEGGGGGEEEEEAPGQLRCLTVLDSHIPLGTVTWRVGGAREVASAAAGAQVQSTELDLSANPRIWPNLATLLYGPLQCEGP